MTWQNRTVMKSRKMKPSDIDILLTEKHPVSHTVGTLLMETDYDTASSRLLLTSSTRLQFTVRCSFCTAQ